MVAAGESIRRVTIHEIGAGGTHFVVASLLRITVELLANPASDWKERNGVNAVRSTACLYIGKLAVGLAVE